MKKFLTAVSLLAFSIPAITCTIFSIYPDNGQHWIGRTFDWSYGHGLVLTNKRNVTKKSIKLLPTDISFVWTSKYGSVSFNQFGKEFPNGGMNETGLMIDALELKSSIYSAADSRPSLNELQFIQYVLDNFSSIESLKEELPKIRLSPVGSKLHYFACDTKHCMTIEFINGELVTHINDELLISGLSNNTYNEHLDYAGNFTTFGGEKPVVMDSKESLDRFVRANYKAKFINEFEDKQKTIFEILDDVGTKNNRWQLIYNQDERTISFRTTSKIDLQRSVDLKSLDFNCSTAGQYFDLDSDLDGSLNEKFLPFDPAVNLSIIKKSVELQKMPAPLADKLSAYSNQPVCTK